MKSLHITSNFFDETNFDTVDQTQLQLSRALQETTQSFIDYLNEDYRAGETEYNTLLEYYIKLHDQLETTETQRSELTKEINQLQRTQTSTNFSYQTDQQRSKETKTSIKL